MKRNRSELSAISVSALDVFASALGVFIILTSVSLPFIFNQSQSNARNLSQAQLEAEMKSSSDPEEAIKELIAEIVALRYEVEELQKISADKSKEAERNNNVAEELTQKFAALEQALKNAENDLESILNTEKTVGMIPPIDIIVALDTTGSMTEQLRSLQGGVIYLARILMKLSESPAIGIVEITDECDYVYRRKFPLQELDSKSLGSLQTFVYSMGQMHTGCNDDAEEGVHLALREALSSKWRANAKKKVIVLVSDFPPYPYVMNEVQSSIKKFSTQGNDTVSIVHPVNSYSTPQHVAIMKNLALLGKGEYIDGAGSVIGAIILAL